MGQTNQSTKISKPAGQVWDAICKFHDMSWAPNVITKVEAVGDKTGNQVGSARILNDLFHKTLLTIDPENRSFSYQITDGPSPILSNEIDNYIGVVKVLPGDNDQSSVVEWTSSWNKNDETVHEFCHNIYVALLSDMKSSLE